MAVTFTRQLGAEPGVQLNPLRDNSEIPTADNADQSFAIACRLTRGRIDKPFAVNRGNYRRKIGKGEPMRKSQLNEAYVHIVEALNNGSYSAVVQRLVPATASLRYAVCAIGMGARLTPVVTEGVISDVTINNAGGGYKTGQIIEFSGSNTTPAVATITVSNGELQELLTTTPGTGYYVGEELHVLSKDGGKLAVATVATLDVSGGIATFTITEGGKDYSVGDAVTFSPVIGSGATANITVTAGVISGVSILNKGSNYKAGQRVKPSVSVGSGAVITVSTVNETGGILTFAITSGGTGYSNGTRKSLIGIYGSGAKADVIDAGKFGEITGVIIANGGTGYTTAAATVSDPISFFASKTYPENSFLFALLHKECFNDGVKVSIWSENKREGGVNVANDKLNIRLIDVVDNSVLYEFSGSLNPLAVDDFDNSNYLPDVALSQTDSVEIVIGDTATIAKTLPCYGYSGIGVPNWETSDVLSCFDEDFNDGDPTYLTADYEKVRDLLHKTDLNYGYISSGGSQSPALLGKLIQLAYDTNRPLSFDIAGNLNKEAAIIFYESLNVGGNFNSSHLVWAYWSPLKSQDPTGINGIAFIGTATLMIAYANARNAVKNATGYARKNYPVAGRDFSLNRRAVTQVVQLSGQDKNNLARAKINPVISETYTGGSRYVFSDCLTGALVDNSLRKLTAVIDMSVDVDDRIARFENDIKHKPIDVAVEETKDFLHKMRADLRAAGWVVPPRDASFSTDYFAYEVKPHDTLVDAIVVNYWPCFVGTTRQMFLTQTLVI